MRIDSPLMWTPSSEASIATTLATTSGPRALSSGMARFSRSQFTSFGRLLPLPIGVLIEPGQMAFTRTPLPPYSTARARVSASTAPLLAP